MSDEMAGSTGAPLPAAPANPVVTTSFTGDYRVDTLLQALELRWNHTAALGTPATVTYSFMTAKPTYGGTDSGTDTGFTAFTQAQKDAARAVFARLQKEIGISFSEVSDSDTAYGQIRLGNNTQGASAGYAYMPNSTGDDKSGDIWLDQSVATNLTNLTPGTAAWATMVHEIGHAIGLKHPGNYNAGEASSPSTQGNFLGAAEDNTGYSIMSYRDAPGALQRDWFGIYDMLALRALYGAGTGTAGNSTYTFASNAGGLMSTVVDTSGIDTIDISASGAASRVDMRAGAFSTVGGTVANNFSIDLATLIENFVGSNQDDTVTGNSANNVITLGQGSNSADGGAGTDTAAYLFTQSSFTITNSAGTLRVSGTGASDTLTNIERLSFSDRKLAFDANGLATAKILGAVFGRASVANLAYEGIGIGLMDGGLSYAGLAQAAINARLGPAPTNEQVVTVLYSNLTGVAPGNAELQLYKGMIDRGELTQAGLTVVAADHALNAANIGLTGLAATGVAFT